MIMDSLRYWVTEMHVDGFRFDLASTLARELHDVDRLGAFFDIIHQDPILSQVKLIAEPWDVGPGRISGGQLSRALDGVERQIPRLRPAVLERRRADSHRNWRPDWLVAATSMKAMAATLTPASTFITAHDGFSLQDLVSYDHKHNEANGEA